MFIRTVKSTSTTQPERAIALASHHARSKRRKPKNKHTTRKQSNFGSKAYQDALQRAFNNAKMQIYFNPDMDKFVTLTYKGTEHTPEQVLYDVKQFIKTERRNGHTDLKYIYVMEYQKRGSIHVHMITNSAFTTHTNKNGYLSLTNWKHGYSSYLTIASFDSNFRSYLYLFKYMRKSQRIGKTFVHASRNLKNYTEIDANLIGLPDWNQEHTEVTEVTLDKRTLTFYRYFMKRDIMENTN